jgi:hypothetical protein
MTNDISLSQLSDSELIELYPSLLKELKARKIIRTNNLIGELGEYLILVVFNKDYSLNAIFELTWDQFIEFRRMKPPENKWNLPVTEAVKKAGMRIK